MGQAAAKPMDEDAADSGGGAGGGGGSGSEVASSSSGIKQEPSDRSISEAIESDKSDHSDNSSVVSSASTVSGASDVSNVSNVSDVPAGDSEQEPADKYCIGGYPPVSISHIIDDRYQVVRKIGFGHFSTVWLCWDNRTPAHAPEFRALKVSKSEKVFADATLSEIDILSRISDAAPTHGSKDYVCGILDHFVFESENGRHMCMVQHCHGENLLQLIQRSDHKGLPEGNVKAILRQMLLGLEYLHDVCGIIHTDIKPENVLVEVSALKVRKMALEAVDLHRKRLPLPPHFVGSHEAAKDRAAAAEGQSGGSTGKRGVREYWKFPDELYLTVLNQEVDDADPAVTECALVIKIADFGNACYIDGRKQEMIQTLPYRSVEVIINAGYGPTADVWSTACLAFEIATGDYLFDGMVGDRFATTEDHLGHIVELLGNVPKGFLKRGKQWRKYFNNRGHLKKQHPKRFWPLFDVLVEKYKWDEDRATLFTELLMPMLKYDPDHRISAGAAAQDKYLTSSSYN